MAGPAGAVPAPSPQPGFRELLRPRDRQAMVSAGAVSRLPLTGAGVAVVIAVGATSGSYAVAGAASAAYVATAAACAPLLGRLMDRLGQGRVLGVASVVQSLALVSLAVACVRGLDNVVLIVCCVVMGTASVDIGSAVRARWAFVLADERRRRTSFMLEAVVDEVMFVVTPLLVTSAAAGFAPLGLLVVAIGPILGWTVLALMRRSAPPVNRAGTPRTGAPRPAFRSLPRLIATFVAIGAYLGSIEILLVALASRTDRPIDAGIALAGWAAGSALAALCLGPRVSGRNQAGVLAAGVTVMATFGLLLPLGSGLLWTVVICFFAGSGAAPALSAGFTLASEAGEPGRRTERMTWLSTGLGCGTTLGALLGGVVADRTAGPEAFALSSLFGIIAFLVALWVLLAHRGTGRVRRASASPAAGRGGTTGGGPAATGESGLAAGELSRPPDGAADLERQGRYEQ